MRMDFSMNTAVNGVAENVGLEKINSRFVVAIGLGDELRQLVRMLMHPAGRSGREARIAFRSARILDAVLVEGLS